jgi:hypothetical protein
VATLPRADPESGKSSIYFGVHTVRRLHEIAATLLPYQTPKLASVSLVPRNINRDQKVTLRIIDHNRDLIEERDVDLPPLITGAGDVVESDRNG